MRIANRRHPWLIVFFIFVCAVSLVYAESLHAEIPSAGTWVGSWAASQQLVEPQNSLSSEDLHDTTLRQIVHLSLGGAEVRIRLSNRFGTAPLHFASVHVSRAIASGSSKIDPATDKAVTFSGVQDVIIPAGADYVSDPAGLTVAPLSDLAISIRFEEIPPQQTGHPGSRATSYLTHGDFVSARDLPDAKKIEHWYFISGVDVEAPGASSIVVLGDSITDGHGATTDGNNRWLDILAQRLQGTAQTQHFSVLNHGIGGNRVLLDGIGPNAMARFDHDVLAQPGVRFLIVLDGVNDLGILTRDGEVSPAEHERLVHSLTTAYEQMIERAHEHGIKVIGCTIMPFMGFTLYHPGPRNEADRQAVNAWIRTSHHFDAVVDFDAVVHDPEHPDRFLPKYDSGDHLHPSPDGYAAMGNAVPLDLFGPGINAPLQIALTFDDLPVHGPLPLGETRLQVITKIISALRDAGVPPIYGFINGQWTETDPSNVPVLRAWRDAGFPLGNHTWSHMDLNQHTLSEFEDEVTRNEPLLQSLMTNAGWHWFRFPFLAEGDAPEKKAGVREFLSQHAYKVAGVTMSFGDYMWNEPYARCKAKGDEKSIALLESSYLEAAKDSVAYSRQLSQSLYNHDIPYVLLMHAGAFDAEMLPRLLELYRSEGFQFITLEQAENDDFYQNDVNPRLPASADTLEQVMADRGLPLPAHPTLNPQPDTLCR